MKDPDFIPCSNNFTVINTLKASSKSTQGNVKSAKCIQ